MRVVRHDPAVAQPDNSPIFLGSVRRQSIVSDDDAQLLRVNSITFEDGARNRLHHHAADQILIVTHGHGLIASEQEMIEIEAGDIVLIPAGERHWHGAQPGREMTHLSVLTPGPLTIDE